MLKSNAEVYFANLQICIAKYDSTTVPSGHDFYSLHFTYPLV